MTPLRFSDYIVRLEDQETRSALVGKVVVACLIVTRKTRRARLKVLEHHEFGPRLGPGLSGYPPNSPQSRLVHPETREFNRTSQTGMWASRPGRHASAECDWPTLLPRNCGALRSIRSTVQIEK